MITLASEFKKNSWTVHEKWPQQTVVCKWANGWFKDTRMVWEVKEDVGYCILDQSLTKVTYSDTKDVWFGEVGRA